jgi:nucleotide-binding universal stress UspA family protein
MYQKILVPLDGSEAGECVLTHVESIASGCNTTEVILFRVCEPPVVLADYPAEFKTSWEDHVRQETEHQQTQCRLYLSDVEKKLSSAGLKVTSVSGLGKPVEEILKYVQQNDIDLIIIASHGHSGITRWAFGNTAQRVIQASVVPVLVVKPLY